MYEPDAPPELRKRTRTTESSPAPKGRATVIQDCSPGLAGALVGEGTVTSYVGGRARIRGGLLKGMPRLGPDEYDGALIQADKDEAR